MSENKDYAATYRAIEDAFFGILWTLQTTRKNDLVNLNLLSTLFSIFLDFCHMLAFFVHRFGWGSITITWGTYARYVQLQLPLYHYEGFAYAFWSAVAVAALIAINAAVVGYSFWTKNFNQLWAIKLLHFIVAVFFNFVFLASFYLLSTPWFCNPLTNFLIPFEKNGQDVECFGFPNILAIVLGTIAIIFLMFLVFSSSLVSAEFEPVPNDLEACCSPVYKIFYFCCLIFMTIDEYYISYVIPEVGHWWEALFNLILVTACLVIIIYYLPFQLQLANELRGGMLGLLWWTAACSFVTVNMKSNYAHKDRVIDYVLLAGLIPFAIFGTMLVKQRYIVIRAFAAGLVDQIEPNFTPTEQSKARYTVRKQDLIPGSQRTPDVYFPKSLQLFGINPINIEIIGRTLWFETADKKSIEAAYKFYRMADMSYPDSAYIKLLRSFCLLHTSEDSSVGKSQYDMIKNMNPPFTVRFQLYKREMESKQKGSSSSDKSGEAAEGEEALDLVAYVEFQKYYLEAQRYNAAAVDAIREFWSLFMRPEVSFEEFNSAACAIEAQTAKALATYKTLLIRYPKHIAILTSYAYFLDLVMHNSEEASRYHRRAEEIRSREAEVSTKTNAYDGKSSDSAVISISAEGTIESVSKTLCTMFGCSRSDLIGRNIKTIVPSPWKESHDSFLDNYEATGVAKVIGKAPKAVFAQHKLGHSFAITLSIQERRKENGDKSFVALITQTDLDTKTGAIIIKNDGTIMLVSKYAAELFGFNPMEMLRQNVNILMPDSYAAHHDGYLSKYRETGEAKVIGTAGRNVPGCKYDGSIFPASLTVTEELIGMQRYYLGNIVDTSTIQATIFMDGFGTVQNVDNGIALLLGYRKENLVGRNIKGIMPPPFNQYHDMYLERYRKTKVSNILKSEKGRLLPAIHADGSTVQMRAIITRVDGNESSNGNMLFKGVLQRVDLISKNVIRRGFENDDWIEISKAGVIKKISQAILLKLGYPENLNPSSFIGISIEMIFPPMNSRPEQKKDVWLPKCLASPDLNFYLLAALRNQSLVPFTISAVLKSTDTITIRMKELLNLDAIISIDELGTIMSFSEDAYLLMGHDPDESCGRNIKSILPSEIAANHDYFLSRYKETRVKKVIGIARVLNSIHRDQSVMPVEIQVAEVMSGDLKTFIARIRHIEIESKLENSVADKMANILIGIEKSEVSGGDILVGEVIKNDTSFIINATQFSNENIDYNSESESEESSDDDEFEEIDHEGIDAKLRYIKESNAEDKSSMALKTALEYSMGLFAIIFIVALIVANVLAKPTNYLSVLDQFMDTSRAISDSVTAARQLQLQQQDSILNNYPCSWANASSDPCVFINNNNVTLDLLTSYSRLGAISTWFTNNYFSLRAAGDDVDSIYSGSHYYYDFIAANPNLPVLTQSATWPDLSNAKLRPYLASIISNSNLNNNATKLAWNFLIYNRHLLYGDSIKLMRGIPGKVNSLLKTEAYIHLGFTLIIFVSVTIVFLFILRPRLVQIISDRKLILRLVLLVPRAIIFQFVNVMYRSNTEDDDEVQDADALTSSGIQDGNENLIKYNSEEVSQITPDKNNKTMMIFFFGMLTIFIPSVCHVAWRFSNDAVLGASMSALLDTAELYSGLYSLRWRAEDLWASECGDATFCSNFTTTKLNVSNMADKMYSLYSSVELQYAGIDEFSDILYRNTQYNPNTKTNFCPSAVNDPTTLKTRCNDTYIGSDIPRDFSILSTRGTGLYVRNILQSAWTISQNNQPSELSVEIFWLIWESLAIEGEQLLKELVLVQKENIEELYASERLASTITYGISLAYMVFLFFAVFGSLRRNLQNEARHNRSILFMIPIEVVKKNKMLLEYVDRVFLDLSS